MIDLYDMLNINRDVLKDFYLLADKVADHQTEKVISQNVLKLKSIEERMLADEGVHVPKQSIDEILYKEVQAAHNDVIVMDDWTMRELRIISYYMMKLQDDEVAFEYALDLLDKGWRNMFFNGLVFYLLNSWCLIKPHLRSKTSLLVMKKLQEYKDNNRRYLLLKNHANMFEEAGPQRLAYFLINQNRDVKDAPTVLGCKSSAISQSYFSDVIVKYCELHPIDKEKLEELLEVHDLKRTKQLLFSNLVMKADENGDAVEQTQLSKFINRTLGDITLTATWAPFLGATEEEAHRLKRAMQQVNLWFTRRIIETFFEVCVQDKDRKRFWLNYVQYVRSFKIVGSTLTKRQLQSDSRVNTMFHRHFIETNSTYSQTAALVLCMKDYVLIEFSDTGSVYAYKQNNNKVQFLKKGTKYMASTNDLKDTSMYNLVENDNWSGTSYNDEGKLVHRGYWQNRLKMWLQMKVIAKINMGTPFLDMSNDDTFTAQPFPKQEKITKPVEQVDKPKAGVAYGSHGQSSTKHNQPRNRQEELFSGVPEYANQSGKSVPTTHSSHRTESSALTNAVYEQNVSYSIFSKWFFSDLSRIVCSSRGYFINILKTKMFVKIKELDGMSPTGSLWVKPTNQQGWVNVIHATAGKEISVGYIKQGVGGLIYKLNLEQTSFMTIKNR